MMGWLCRRAVSLVNVRVLTDVGVARSVRFRRRVLSLDEGAAPGDVVVDLEGAWVLPGLINAHDHLELNHYGAWPGSGAYGHASEWMAEVGGALERDPEARGRRGWPLGMRLFVGGLKNLLAGVTTVAHHNPRYRELGSSVPIRVVWRYGWAHSFDLEHGRAGANGETGGSVRERHRATPASRPFMMHLAEGTDRRAQGELARLDAFGGLTANTVAIHGVGLLDADVRRLVSERARLVWCPGSNLAMFGQTAPVGRWSATVPGLMRHLALGTNSRLTGTRDLLQECALAARTEPRLGDDVLALVTTSAARALRERHAGRLECGAPADLVVFPGSADSPAGALLGSTRREVALVVVGGRPLVGHPSLRSVFAARRVTTGWMVVDGAEKIAARPLCAALAALPVGEPGVEARSCA